MKSWFTKLHGAEVRVMRLGEPTDAPLLDSPERCVPFLRDAIAKSIVHRHDVENAWVIMLNTRRKPIAVEHISTGTLDTVLLHAREIFKPAIVLNAAAIVLAHNHPSGDPSPSEADIKVTRDLVRAGKLMRIECLDHVILGTPGVAGNQRGWVSLRELGYFYKTS